MGYSITIGEYYTYKEDGRNWADAHTVTLPNAPAYNEPTDYTNERWPSYTAWSDFSDFVGLPLYKTIGKHPGWLSVTKKLKSEIDEAYSNFMVKYPNAIARMGDKDKPENYQLARLTWLKFWVDWALENCKKPIIYNS